MLKHIPRGRSYLIALIALEQLCFVDSQDQKLRQLAARRLTLPFPTVLLETSIYGRWTPVSEHRSAMKVRKTGSLIQPRYFPAYSTRFSLDCVAAEHVLYLVSRTSYEASESRSALA